MIAAEIVEIHGYGAPNAVLNTLGDILSDPQGCDNWRRVSIAVDEILDARSQ